MAERIRAALSGSASGRPLRAAVDVPPETPGRPRGNPGQHPHPVHRQHAVDPKDRCVITCPGDLADGREGDAVVPILERA